MACLYIIVLFFGRVLNRGSVGLLNGTATTTKKLSGDLQEILNFVNGRKEKSKHVLDQGKSNQSWVSERHVEMNR